MSQPSPDPSPPPVGGVALTRESRANRGAWIERNPLRSWRLNQTPAVTIYEAAERLGVGASMIQMYEKGVHKPGPKAEAALALYLGDDWSLRWDEWLATRDQETKL